MRLVITLIICCSLKCYGQQSTVDSTNIERVYLKAKAFWYINADSTVHYLKLTDELSKQASYRRGEANALKGLGFFSRSNYERLQYYIKALEIRETIHDSLGIGVSLGDIAHVYKDLHDYEKMTAYFNRSLEIRQQINDYGGIALIYIQLGQHEEGQKNYDNALSFFNQALKYRELAGEPNGLGYAHLNLALLYNTLKKFDQATIAIVQAMDEFKKGNNPPGYDWAVTVQAEILFETGNTTEALRLMLPLERNLHSDRQHQVQKLVIIDLLSKIYERQMNFEKALFFKNAWIEEKLHQELTANNEATQRLALDYEYRIKERELKKMEEQQLALKKRRANLQLLLISIGVISLFSLIVSMRKRIPDRFINALAFIGFLFVFEFLVVLIEPRLQDLTDEEPLLVLLVNALIALAIFPVHQYIEKYFKKRIIASKQLAQHGELIGD